MVEYAMAIFLLLNPMKHRISEVYTYDFHVVYVNAATIN